MAAGKALVACPDKPGPTLELANAIVQGIAQTGVGADLLAPQKVLSLDEYGLVFLGSGVYGFNGFSPSVLKLVFENDFSGKRTALFITHSGGGAKAVEKLAAELGAKGARVVGTLQIRPSGLLGPLGRGKLSETDRVRAVAFGEKQAYRLVGHLPSKEHEKREIRGYLK